MSKLNIKNIRYFNDIEIVDNNTNIIKKYIGNDGSYKQKFYDEIIWMINAQKTINGYVPKVIDYSLNMSNLWLKYEMIQSDDVHKYFINEKDFNWHGLKDSYVEFINECKKFKPFNFIKEEWRNKLIDFYLVRTYNNLIKLREQNKDKLKMFFDCNLIYINNIEYPSIKLILSFLKNKIRQLKNENILDSNDIFNKLVNVDQDRIFLTHLDLIFGNVFYDENNKKIKVIDPRGSFSDSKEFGDIYYDYAKIYQSIFGLYDFIVEDKFVIKKIDKNSIIFDIQQPKNIKEIQLAFAPIFPRKDIDVIKLLEALQFFSMTPAHNDNSSRQAVQLCIGIIHLYNIFGHKIWEK